MYCRNCGKEIRENALFCSACGVRISIDESEQIKSSSDRVLNNDNQSEDVVEKSDGLKAKEQSGNNWMNNVQIIFLLLCIVISVVGIVKGCRMLQEKEREQQKLEREWRIKSTLAELGNRSSGSTDFNTAQYSMALSFFTSAALGKSNISDYAGLNAEEIKAECFKTLEAYFEGDYLKSYAALVFCSDYFTKEDAEYFYDGTKVNEQELKECVKALLFENNISLANLLVDEQDEEICYTMNLRIRLADDGYMAAEDMIWEVYQFVYDEKPVKTIGEELLAEEITYEQVASNIVGSFTGKKLYYEDLSPVGKLVFLYVMPRYIAQFDQEAGAALWNDYYFKTQFNYCWEEIVERDIFSKIIE